MSGYEHWSLSQNDRIATLTLNRAEAMNSLTPETLFELRDITTILRDAQDVWVVVVEGSGEHFSVGFDVNVIRTLIDYDEDEFREGMRELQGCLDAFEALNKVTIARLDGYCLGGGLLLALCCDFRIASERTIFGFPEVKRGLAVILGTQRVTRIAGVAATKKMILLAENFKAGAALNYGLLHQIVPPDKLDATVATLADKLRHLPPRTVGAAKRIIDYGHAPSLRESQDYELEVQADLLDSQDMREAVESFLEKRAPNFRGD